MVRIGLEALGTDGSGSCTTGTTASSCTIALTTTLNNDNLVLGQDSGLSNTACDSSTPTDTATLTWQLKKSQGRGTSAEVCLWYTTWTSHGSDTITCKESGNARMACEAFAVSGADTSTIWDSNAAAVCGASGSASPATCNISTSNANDMLIGVLGLNNNNAVTAGSGFALIPTTCPTSSTAKQSCAEDKTVSATQTNTAVSFTFSSGNWESIGAAMMQASSGPTTFSRTEAETPALTDAISKLAKLATSEPGTITDSISKLAKLTASSTATLTDTIVKQANLVMSDTGTLLDQLGFAKTFAFVIAETATLVDQVSKKAELLATDAGTLTDSIAKSVSLTASEVTSIVDAVQKKASLLMAETTTLADSIVKLAELNAAEATTLSDQIAKALVTLVSMAENLATTDGIQKLAKLLAQETTSLLDQLSCLLNGKACGTTLAGVKDFLPIELTVMFIGVLILFFLFSRPDDEEEEETTPILSKRKERQ